MSTRRKMLMRLHCFPSSPTRSSLVAERARICRTSSSIPPSQKRLSKYHSNIHLSAARADKRAMCGTLPSRLPIFPRTSLLWNLQLRKVFRSHQVNSQFNDQMIPPPMQAPTHAHITDVRYGSKRRQNCRSTSVKPTDKLRRHPLPRNQPPCAIRKPDPINANGPTRARANHAIQSSPGRMILLGTKIQFITRASRK